MTPGFNKLTCRFQRRRKGDFMFKAIIEYFKLKKLYKDSKKVLMVNAAEVISSIKNITAILEQLMEAEKDG